MLCFRLIFWAVVLFILLFPGFFLVGIIGRIAGFRPGSQPGPVEKAFGWFGIVFLTMMMFGICVVAGFVDWVVGTTVENVQQHRAQNPPPFNPGPFNPPNNPPIKPAPVRKNPAPKPIRPEWDDAKMEKRYLSEMQEFGVQVGWGTFGKKGKLGYFVGNGGDIRVAGQLSPNGISMHPPSNGSSIVKYRLNRDYMLYTAEMGLSDTENPFFTPGSPATFEVYGDGTLLWMSNPMQRITEKQACRLSVEGVEILELQVHCSGSHSHVRAVWLEPYVLK